MTVPEVPEFNATTLGLYVMPDEAYRMWEADPDGVHVLDVRTFPEYVFGGHPEMARNIPLVFPKFDPEGPTMPGRPPGCTGDPNPDFVAMAKEAFGSTDTIPKGRSRALGTFTRVISLTAVASPRSL